MIFSNCQAPKLFLIQQLFLTVGQMHSNSLALGLHGFLEVTSSPGILPTPVPAGIRRPMMTFSFNPRR
jgi:hypothetical protein